MRGRGLKHLRGGARIWHRAVASRAGAWIETLDSSQGRARSRVASRAGAWIETCSGCLKRPKRSVASRAGAWIETIRSENCESPTSSPPVRGRGLKQLTPKAMKLPTASVASRAGAWIETNLDHRKSMPSVVASRAGAWIETILGRPRPPL